jgi:hypothetical protein
LEESNQISQKDAFSDFEKVSARDLVEDIYKPAFDLRFGNRLEQHQQPLTERNTTARTLFNDNIELSTSIVDQPVKESIEEPEKEKNQEEPVVCEAKPEPLVEEAKQEFSHPAFAPLNSLEVATQQIDEACREA